MVYIGGYRVADSDHLQHLDLEPEEQGDNEVVPWSPALVGDCALKGLEKGNYSDIPKACHHGCKKITDRLS